MAWTHSDRNRLAIEQGFRNYYDKRKALEGLINTRYQSDITREKGLEHTARTAEFRDIALLRSRAMQANTTHEVGGLKYLYFVEVLEIMTLEEWEERY